MRFVSLHHHSTYSFLDGFGHPEQHVKRAAELGMSALALTEHGNVSSHVKLEQAAIEAGIKPIYGCELYTGPNEPVRRKNHLSVWAQDQRGYQDLLSMLTWAWSKDGGFYYEPTVTGPIFKDHSQRLIVGSGCTGSLLATSLIGGKNVDPAEASFDRGLSVAAQFRDLLGDRYYLEVQQFPELEATRSINPFLEEISRKLKIPLVATADVHYCLPEDNEMQKILHAVRPGSRKTVEDQAREWSYDVLLCHPTSDEELLKRLVATGLSVRAANEAVASTEEIAGRCDLTLPRAASLRYPSSQPSEELWRTWLRSGWQYRKIDERPNSEEYAARLKREVAMIESKEFIDYFLIVSDMARWAKDHGIFVGPARGSAAASLVCYLLRITEIDPMLFPDLVFERFIDVTRTDLPDIDLDFDDNRREEVFKYLRKKYGDRQVNTLGTFSTFKAKMALGDIGRVYKVPYEEVEKVKELLIGRSSGDLRASATIEDTVKMFPVAAKVFEDFPDLEKSYRIEGMVKGMGKHAAGAIVASEPLTNVCAIYGDKISMDKHDAEYLNMLKIDTLGLSTCGLLSEAIALLGMSFDDLYTLPLDDEATIQGFKDDDVVGIFQFDGRAMRIVNHNLKPDDFYEICAVNSLARPGPLHSNATADYIDVKHGSKEREMHDPMFDQITAHTYGQVVYQEQILRIVRELGNFDWTAATYIRKVMSKKTGEQAFNREWKRFRDGTRANGIADATAKRIWNMCITAGNYAFNAAHAVSYGTIAYWSMWLKVHHPLEFYVSALRRLPTVKQIDLLRDAKRHGIKILPPDPMSGLGWELGEGKTIKAGLVQIPGIGEKMAEQMISWREGRTVDWADYLAIRGIGPKKMQMMQEFAYQDDPLGIDLLDRKLAHVVQQIEKGELKTRDGSNLPRPTHTASEVPSGRGRDTQVVWIGTIAGRNLRELFEYYFSRNGKELDPKTVRDPEKREWVLMQGVDSDDAVTVTIDRWRYPKFKEAVFNIKLNRDLVLVRGVKKGSDPKKEIYVSEMWVLE